MASEIVALALKKAPLDAEACAASCAASLGQLHAHYSRLVVGPGYAPGIIGPGPDLFEGFGCAGPDDATYTLRDGAPFPDALGVAEWVAVGPRTLSIIRETLDSHSFELSFRWGAAGPERFEVTLINVAGPDTYVRFRDGALTLTTGSASRRHEQVAAAHCQIKVWVDRFLHDSLNGESAFGSCGCHCRAVAAAARGAASVPAAAPAAAPPGPDDGPVWVVVATAPDGASTVWGVAASRAGAAALGRTAWVAAPGWARVHATRHAFDGAPPPGPAGRPETVEVARP